MPVDPMSIQLLELKCPPVLMFDSASFQSLGKVTRVMLVCWPRLLEKACSLVFGHTVLDPAPAAWSAL